MNSGWSSFLIAALAVICGGLSCELYTAQATQAPHSVTPEVKVVPTLAVLQCASLMQRIAFDSGKRLADRPALDFCAAVENSPDIEAPISPTLPPNSTGDLGADVPTGDREI